jgi:2-oxo-4-hydroxy-4-carboxy-5-ureidoimidazoline decarboxylase
VSDNLGIAEINKMDAPSFIAVLGGVFEHSPWIAERAFAAKPFKDVDTLHLAMIEVVSVASEEEQLALIRAHPDLAGKVARAGEMTDFSVSEQASVGLDQMSQEEFDTFNRLNTAYKDRFGFPFIVAVRDHDKASILQAYDERQKNESSTERAEAMKNILRITELRLKDLFSTV